MRGGCGLECHLLANALSGAAIPTAAECGEAGAEEPFVSARGCGSVCDSNNPIELCSDSELCLFEKTGYHKDC